MNGLLAQRWRWVYAAVGLGLIAASAVWIWWHYRPNPSSTDPTPVGLRRPAKPSGEYVGSERCVECHEEIAQQYHDTQPMAHSLATVSDADPIENWDRAEFLTEGGRVYQVERAGEKLFHHELLRDEQGNTIYDQAMPVSFSLGSGERGRSYLIVRDGLVFQSPISWYSQKKKWALSPGFPPANHERFESRVTEDCLFCHSGSTLPANTGGDRFAEQVFRETSIGCERCHGPGKDHVAYQEGNTDVKDTIVNPARLEPARRDAVCYQCHFRARHSTLRYGRRPDDFRPGNRYDDIWVALVEPIPEEGPSNSHTIVEQFESSLCFRRSNEQLSCTTCHDPHLRPPAEERADFFRDRCLECHAEKPCTLPIAEQQAAPAEGSCVHCHMPRLATDNVPHTALTDHRLLRQPRPTSTDAVDPRTLVFFKMADRVLPEREQERARGIVFAHAAANMNNPMVAAEAARLLNPNDSFDPDQQWIQALGDDVEALHELGLALIISGEVDFARACWQRVLEVKPAHEGALGAIMMSYEREEHWDQALQYADRLLKQNPFRSSTHWTKTLTLARLGRTEEAIQAAQSLLEHDPSAWFVRAWLAQTYQSIGRQAESQQQYEILKRWPRSSSGPPASLRGPSNDNSQ